MCSNEVNFHDVFDVLWNANRHFGDSLAVLEYGKREGLDYATLYKRVCNIAKYLATECEISKGDRVAIVAQNCTEVMELHYAVAAIHGVVVNINIHLAPVELQHQLTDSGTVLILAETEFESTVFHALDSAESSVKQIIWIGPRSTNDRPSLLEVHNRRINVLEWGCRWRRGITKLRLSAKMVLSLWRACVTK